MTEALAYPRYAFASRDWRGVYAMGGGNEQRPPEQQQFEQGMGPQETWRSDDQVWRLIEPAPQPQALPPKPEPDWKIELIDRFFSSADTGGVWFGIATGLVVMAVLVLYFKRGK